MADLPLTFSQQGERIQLAGVLTMDTVPQAWQRRAQWFEGQSQLVVDLAQIEQSDSAGLALLVSLQRMAQRLQTPVTFQQVPANILGLARVSGLLDVLSLAD